MPKSSILVGFNRDVRSGVGLPIFDLHQVEEALLVVHRVFGGQPMTREEITVAVHQYREFLWKHKIAGMPEKFEVPSLVVDRVWHVHMCETKQYARDCQEYFGQMFHHASLLCDGGAKPGDW